MDLDLLDFVLPKYQPKCDICYISFITVAALSKHYVDAHNKRAAYQCQLCPKELSRKFIYQKHYKKLHLNDQPGIIPDAIITYQDPPKPTKKLVSATLSKPTSGRETIILDQIPNEQFERKNSKTKVTCTKSRAPKSNTISAPPMPFKETETLKIKELQKLINQLEEHQNHLKKNLTVEVESKVKPLPPRSLDSYKEDLEDAKTIENAIKCPLNKPKKHPPISIQTTLERDLDLSSSSSSSSSSPDSSSSWEEDTYDPFLNDSGNVPEYVPEPFKAKKPRLEIPPPVPETLPPPVLEPEVTNRQDTIIPIPIPSTSTYCCLSSGCIHSNGHLIPLPKIDSKPETPHINIVMNNCIINSQIDNTNVDNSHPFFENTHSNYEHHFHSNSSTSVQDEYDYEHEFNCIPDYLNQDWFNN